MAEKAEAFGKLMFWGTLLCLIFFLSTVAIVLRTHNLSQDPFEESTQSQKIFIKVSRLLSQLKDAETSQRVYIMTGNEEYLAPFNKTTDSFRREVLAIQVETIYNPYQQGKLIVIKRLIRQRLAELNHTIDLRKDQGMGAAMQVIQADRGKNLMGNIRRVAMKIGQEERRMVVEHQKQASATVQIAAIGLFAGAVLTLTFAALIFFKMRRDLIERQRAEAALQKSQAETDAIITGMLDSLITIDERGIIEVFNPAAEQTFGYASSEMIGRHIQILMPASYRDKHNHSFNNYLRTGEARIVGLGPLEVEGQRKDSSTFPFELAVNEVKSWDGRRFVGIGRDITERKEAEGILIKKKEDAEKANWLRTRLAELHEKIQGEMDPVKMGQNIINHLVQHTRTQTGGLYLKEESFLRLIASCGYNLPADDSIFFNVGEGLVGQAAQEKRSILVTQVPEGYIKIQSGLGATVPKNILITPFCNEGQVIGVIELGSLNEINDDQKKFLDRAADGIARVLNSARMHTRMQELLNNTQILAEKLSTQNETIAQQKADLEQTIKETEIARAAAEKANASKSQFLSTMSHELRTPLNAILGFSDLLKRQHFGELNPKQAGHVAHILTSGQHLLDLINDLLDIAKIDAGALALDLEVLSVEEHLANAVALMSAQFGKKEIEVKIHIDPAVTTLTGDPRKFKQIMLNLLSNAVKYTPEKGRVDIRAEPGEGHVRISVTDTGIGIEKEDQDKVFDEFLQVDRVRDENLGGTGIGLALTRRLVELHGGEIGVDSTPGKGSTFWFTLPLKSISEKEAEPEEKEANHQPADSPHLAQHRILVVEDNEVNISMMQDVLSIGNHQVSVARNGQQAIDLAVSQKPELIFMDIRMPVMDGLEATRKLRALPEFATIPIIALTATVGEEAQRGILDAGCTDYLSKPVQISELLEVLDRHL